MAAACTAFEHGKQGIIAPTSATALLRAGGSLLHPCVEILRRAPPLIVVHIAVVEMLERGKPHDLANVAATDVLHGGSKLTLLYHILLNADCTAIFLTELLPFGLGEIARTTPDHEHKHIHMFSGMFVKVGLEGIYIGGYCGHS